MLVRIPALHALFSGDPMGVPAINACTMKNSSYYVCNNPIDSPDKYIPYDGINGPNDGHEWLIKHPFY